MSSSITRPFKSHRSRRGSVYMLVLGMGAMLTVIGLAIAVTGRVNGRNAAADRDCELASTLAAGAVDLGIATINSDSSWRSSRGSDSWHTPVTLGNGSATWKQTDRIDNDMQNNPDQPVYVSGMATVGAAVREYSVQAVPVGTRPLPVLACTLHSAAGIVVTSTIAASGGPLSTNLALNNQSTITGNVEAGSVVNTGSIVGFVTAPAAAKSVPGIDLFTTYQGRATEVSYASIASGAIISKVISAANNPWGSGNAAGIYYIRVPTAKTLIIRDSVIQACLVIQLQGTAQLIIRDLVAWDPPSAGVPSMIAHGTATASVLARTDVGTASIPLTSVNILGLTVVVGSMASAPSEFHGLFHVMGGATTSFQQSPRIIGTWISDGAVTATANLRMIADPNLTTNPPYGYTYIDGTVTAVPGSFHWQSR